MQSSSSRRAPLLSSLGLVLLACSSGAESEGAGGADGAPRAQAEAPGSAASGPRAAQALGRLREVFPRQRALLTAEPGAQGGSEGARVTLAAGLRQPLGLAARSVRLRVELQGAADSEGAEAEGLRLYEGGLGEGADVVRRPLREGVEDLFVFHARPERGEVRYRVEVGEAAGLRLTSNVLEFLDQGGMPRLRVTAPVLADADGELRPVRIEVDGCEVDRSTAPPWGRPLTAPGRPWCTVAFRFDERALRYPALLDPMWSGTGSMTYSRIRHEVVALSDNTALVVGGQGSTESAACPLGMCTLLELWKNGVFSPSGDLVYQRREPGVARLSGDRVLIVAGDRNPTGGPGFDCDKPGESLCYQAEMWQAGAVTPAGKMARARSLPGTVTLSGDRVLVVGGGGSTTACPPSGQCPDIELWDKGVFSPAGSLTVGREDLSAIGLPGDRVVVIGGENKNDATHCPGSYCRPIEVWAGGSVSQAGQLPHGRTQQQAAALPDGRVAVFGGKGTAGTCTNERCRNTYIWSDDGTVQIADNLLAEIEDFRAAALGDGSVLVAGGYSDACADGYCSISQVWKDGVVRSAGALQQSRSFLAMARLTDGRVLVAGGDSSNCSPVCNSAELFDPTQPKLGGACTTNQHCSNSVCVKYDPNVADLLGSGYGMCVDSACDSLCYAYLEERTGQPNGVCAPILGNTDPFSDCSSSFCNKGVCDGKGACAVDHLGESCAPAKCKTASSAQAPAFCTANATCDGKITDCGAYACQGGACLASCTTAADCSSGNVCVGGGCVPGLAQGQPCGAAEQCVSGKCVDGVCCDAACDGACQACTAALKGGGADGACGPLADGQPDALCPTAGECGADGRCNAAGACRTAAPSGTPCSSTCADVGTSTPRTCDGKGTCASAGLKACGAYACDSATGLCHSTCSTGADCAAGFYCSGDGGCVAKKALGASCADAAECQSSKCVDQVCCDAACDGACQACAAALKASSTGDGLCGAAKADTLDALCPTAAGCGADGRCDAAGACRTQAPAGASCGPPACENGSQVQPQCDAAGVCQSKLSQSCGLYACDASAGACRFVCESSADCAPGASCNLASKQCVQAGATCAGPFSVKTADGKEQSCEGYQCIDGSGCRDTCGAPSECAPGYQCKDTKCLFDGGQGGSAGSAGKGGAGGSGGAGKGGSGSSGASGQGGASAGAAGKAGAAGAAQGGSSTAAPASDDGGCGCRAAGSPAPGRAGWLGLGLAALALARRRRG